MKILTLTLALALTACQKDETISGQTSPADTWHLATLNGTPVTTPITLTFPTPGKIAGRAPCNQYHASQTAPLPWFEAGPIAATKRACPNLALENTYLKTLASITLIERTGNTLLLTNDTGNALEFQL